MYIDDINYISSKKQEIINNILQSKCGEQQTYREEHVIESKDNKRIKMYKEKYIKSLKLCLRSFILCCIHICILLIWFDDLSCTRGVIALCILFFLVINSLWHLCEYYSALYDYEFWITN